MDTMNGQRLGATVDTSAPLQLVRAGAALRWKRPDLTATLAELALDAAEDAATWVTAAGWLLHGRAVLGDGRQVACDLIEASRGGATAVRHLMTGPQGRRLRVELGDRPGAQATRRPPGRSWQRIRPPTASRANSTRTCSPGARGVRSTMRRTRRTPRSMRRAGVARHGMRTRGRRRAAVACRPRPAGGPAAAAAVGASTGLARVTRAGAAREAPGRTIAAALTAEWIAALVDAGRVDEARSKAVPAAKRLLTTARPSRSPGCASRSPASRP